MSEKKKGRAYDRAPEVPKLSIEEARIVGIGPRGVKKTSYIPNGRRRGRPRKNPEPVEEVSEVAEVQAEVPQVEEKPKSKRKRSPKKTARERLLDEAEREPETVEIKVPRRTIDALSEEELDEALERVIIGERIKAIADEYGVSQEALSLLLRKRCGLFYLKSWQNAIKFDCLRGELILNRAMRELNGENPAPKWGALALDVLAYRARVLGFDRKDDANKEQTIRVAGLGADEIFETIAGLL